MSDKQLILNTVQKIDDKKTYEEILYTLYLQLEVQKGIKDMGIEIGHKVLICRCGMIIPKIVKDIDTGKYAKGYEF